MTLSSLSPLLTLLHAYELRLSVCLDFTKCSMWACCIVVVDIESCDRRRMSRAFTSLSWLYQITGSHGLKCMALFWPQHNDTFHKSVGATQYYQVWFLYDHSGIGVGACKALHWPWPQQVPSWYGKVMLTIFSHDWIERLGFGSHA